MCYYVKQHIFLNSRGEVNESKNLSPLCTRAKQLELLIGYTLLIIKQYPFLFILLFSYEMTNPRHCCLFFRPINKKIKKCYSLLCFFHDLSNNFGTPFKLRTQSIPKIICKKLDVFHALLRSHIFLWKFSTGSHVNRQL